jgi:putative sigma-54 modulation protein
MQTPLQVTFEGCEPLESVRAEIEREAERLTMHNHRVIGCHVAVIAPSDKHRHGTGFEVRIRVTAPPHEDIIVNHASSDEARREHVGVAVREAFSSARRQIDDLAEQS